jgi:hypothetical protein
MTEFGLDEEFIFGASTEFASEKDLEYMEENPEASIVVYHLRLWFLILLYNKEAHATEWQRVAVDVMTSKIDPVDVYYTASESVIEEYEPKAMYFVGYEVVEAWRVNPVYGVIEEFPEEYWSTAWEGLNQYIREVTEVLEW